MNTQKVIAFAAAMAITAANLWGIAAYTNAVVRNSQAATRATTEVIKTLPAIEVTPSAEQRRELRKEGGKADQAATTSGTAMMPYYSFAADTTSA
ncbi:MAG TPA: hypothetical protein VFL63_09710 [Rhodanobacteraceae bacterium]|jgi:hypothetical protein|nr:hypothetical protein [Rhodanobacteraceae bacterium]